MQRWSRGFVGGAGVVALVLLAVAVQRSPQHQAAVLGSIQLLGGVALRPGVLLSVARLPAAEADLYIDKARLGMSTARYRNMALSD